MSAQAFERSLSDRLKQRAALRPSTSVNQVRREYYLQRFLARVFTEPDGPWILKGGTGLLVRLPEARHSQDIDLLQQHAATVEDAVEDLKALAHAPSRLDDGDHLRFTVGTVTAMTGPTAGAQVRVEVWQGANKKDTFPIDLAAAGTLIGAVDITQPQPIVDIPALAPLPPFRLYSLGDQVADKVCAMYETHGPHQKASTRYRDLVDLVLIATHLPLDAAPTLAALKHQAHRRQLQLPARLTTPGTGWVLGYRAIASNSQLPPELRDLHAALERAGSCLNPLLTGQIATGTWNHPHGTWTA
jgi:Nucleotidyl transferase AbiEii toxin, Type IV TA system